MSVLGNPRIAILGAGPSGLTIAYFLKALGLKSVQFFEALNDVGGQSVTPDVDGVPVEMGTVYLTDGYILAKHIAKGVGCPARVLPAATVLKENGDIEKNPERPGAGLMVRYVYHWLRWYFAGQMRAPTWKDNALSFKAWLENRGLGELATGFVFTAGLTAQLYGPVKDISAHSGLNWMRPSLLITGRFSQTAHIPEGFQNMWRKLAKQLGFTVQTTQRIDTVRPIRAGDSHQVELLEGGKPVDEPFDHVFIACPLDYLEDHPQDQLEGNPTDRLEHPLAGALENDYSPFAATEVYSAAWRGTHWPKDAPSRCYLPAAGTDKRGPLLTIRNYGPAVGGDHVVGQLCSYAFLDEPLGGDPEENQKRLEHNRKQVVEDMQNIVKLRNVEIVQDRLWRYNIRYSLEQLHKGLPLFIEGSQGKQNVWYTGGTLSHWNIDAITDYNQVLAKRFAKQIGLPFLTRLKLYHLADLFRDF